MERTYTIRELEYLCGIKAHTIRVWEKRYKLFNPVRNPNNVRNYTEVELKKIMNVSLLYQNGFKISKIAAFTPSELQSEALKYIVTDRNENDPQLQFVLFASAFDSERIERLFGNLLLRHGFENLYLKVIIPLTQKLKLHWQVDLIGNAEECFLIEIFRQKLYQALDATTSRPNNSVLKFLFSPIAQHRHLVKLPFLHYLSKSRNINNIFLPKHLSESELSKVIQKTKPLYFVSVIENEEYYPDALIFIEKLSKLIPNQRILIVSEKVEKNRPEISSKIEWIRNIENFIVFSEALYD